MKSPQDLLRMPPITRVLAFSVSVADVIRIMGELAPIRNQSFVGFRQSLFTLVGILTSYHHWFITNCRAITNLILSFHFALARPALGCIIRFESERIRSHCNRSFTWEHEIWIGLHSHVNPFGSSPLRLQIVFTSVAVAFQSNFPIFMDIWKRLAFVFSVAIWLMCDALLGGLCLCQIN